MTEAETPQASRVALLSRYLEQDPGNARLAVECAEAALEAGQPALALTALAQVPEDHELSDRAGNLAGLAAMRSGDQATAQRHFSRLLEQRPDDPALRFNLAWSRALEGDAEGARETLDDALLETLPQAALLDLQLAHRFDDDLEPARAKMAAYLARHGDYAPLQAAASVLAMELGDTELARACASKAGDHPDALATLGALDLGQNLADEAKRRFSRSLQLRSDNPRAHIGLGLAKLASGDKAGACLSLDKGAEQFRDHLGSWIAAGWAHCLAGDPEQARARFETALVLDDTFAEAQGSLAALDALTGDLDAARQRLDRAVRLDRASFSAALAGTLLAQAEGDEEGARRLFERASTQPLTHDGKTLAQALAAMAL